MINFQVYPTLTDFRGYLGIKMFGAYCELMRLFIKQKIKIDLNGKFGNKFTKGCFMFVSVVKW